ncbi:MAG TPA: hypothetical protein DEA22_08840, partial [Blastocatellia bacterium]|nr:hypothetical protein [Blastocatellia bacterium]
DWTVEAGNWKIVTIDEQVCTVKSADEPTKCTFTAKKGGTYKISALVMDDRERFNESVLTVWVPGGKTPPNRNVEQQEVQLIPSGKDFAPGDVAELLVIAPFTPAEGVMTLRRDGIAKTERFSMKDSSVTLKIPIKESYLPNIHVQIDLVGAAERTAEGPQPDPSPNGKDKKADLAKRPAFASGTIDLSVSTESRRLSVSAEPREKNLIPGGETKVDVAVKDGSGEPVANSEVAVVIVDESVLALTRYSIADPMSIFYSPRSAGTRDYHLRNEVLLGNPDDVKKGRVLKTTVAARAVNLAALRPGIAQAASMDITMDGINIQENAIATLPRASWEENERAEPENPIMQRTNFDALAVFAPGVKTDSDGHAV